MTTAERGRLLGLDGRSPDRPLARHAWWRAGFRPGWLTAVLLVSGGAALRLVPWLALYPLHRDEALYGTWARSIASGRDPWLLTAWVDKPPLAVYAIAGSFRLFGVSDLSLRLPGMLAGVLSIPILWAVARRAYWTLGRDTSVSPVPLIAAGLYAICPFAILFGPTAFTDPWLVLWLLSGAWAALDARPLVAGLALGLAVASKQQGLLAVPLVLAFLWVGVARRAQPAPVRRGAWTRTLRACLWVLLGFALVFGPLMYWDSLRWAKRPSFWDRSLATYGGLALAPLSKWPQRAAEWGQQLGYLFGGPVATGLVLALAAAAVGLAAVSLGRRQRLEPAAREGATSDVLLALYVAGYLALHFAITFQPWDRYLLPLAPLLAVLAARGIVAVRNWLGLHRPAGSRAGAAAVCALALCLGWGTWLGVSGQLPVGSDHGAYAGLDRIVARWRALPADAVIYHRWLGWYYDFYLFDAPQERRWWGSAWKLADDAAETAAEQPHRAQWLAIPDWEDEAAGQVRLALASRRLVLDESERIYRPDGSRAFTLYQIVSARKYAAQ